MGRRSHPVPSILRSQPKKPAHIYFYGNYWRVAVKQWGRCTTYLLISRYDYELVGFHPVLLALRDMADVNCLDLGLL